MNKQPPKKYAIALLRLVQARRESLLKLYLTVQIFQNINNRGIALGQGHGIQRNPDSLAPCGNYTSSQMSGGFN
jgi:hypothetical protein